MKGYRLLVIAWYAGITHVSEFIKNLKSCNPCAEVSLLTSKPSLNEVPKELIESTVEIFCCKYYSGHIKNKLIAGLVTRFYFIRTFFRLSKKNYDIVDIHFAKPRLYHVRHWIKMISDNIVISPWGSDVLRVEGERNIKRLRKVYAIARYVTVGKDSQIGQRLVSEMKVAPDKLVRLGWGGELFDYIRENAIRVTPDEAKARFDLNGRYVITCGYNTQKEQRHEEILNAIASVRDQLPENLTLLFPFTYGRAPENAGYIEFIKEEGRRLGFDLVAVEEHLNLPDLFLLRMATDMFVHVQTTDAGSRCVMEYVSCNKKVVHGSWMRYAYLEDYHPSCYFPVDKIENLGECIVKAYKAQVEPLPKEVVDIILERGWKYKMGLWNGFFESLV